jgi:hypothetical protein
MTRTKGKNASGDEAERLIAESERRRKARIAKVRAMQAELQKEREEEKGEDK